MAVNENVKTRRVVITGVGALSPVGLGADKLFDAAVKGEVGINKLEMQSGNDVNVFVAGQIKDFDAVQHGLTKKQARRWERFVQYAAVASDEAMRSSGLVQDASEDDGTATEAGFKLAEGVDAERFATVFGSGIGGMEIFTSESIKLHEKGAKRVNPLFVPTMISNIAAGELAIRYGLQGECSNCVVACTTGTQCIGEAYRLIKYGMADYALAGGAEESVCDIAVAGFSNLGALTHCSDPEQASRPFDVNRDGFVVGEGAGALVLESLDSAKARNANIIAEVVGFGTSCDAHHITAPDPSGKGVLRAMSLALKDAGMSPSDIGHLNAHGTSTVPNDQTEARALCQLLGVDYCDTPVTSTKGIVGHMLGAAGAVEAIVTALSVASNLVPMTAGFSEQDEQCPVTVLKETRTNVSQTVALSNSIGFGGHNATLAIAPINE